MSSIEDNKIIELFGQSTRLPKQPSWVESVESQWCPYTDSKYGFQMFQDSQKSA